MSKYTTGEIAKLCDVSVRTVQYYDSRGILVPSELSEGGRRLYTENDLKRMKMICFLREIGFSINQIRELLSEKDPGSVITILLDQQQQEIQNQLTERQIKLKMIEELKKEIKEIRPFSVDSIGDIAYMMKNKWQLKNLRGIMIIIGIIMDILEIGTAFLWWRTGIWWPFLLGMGIVILLGIWVSVFYFRRVSYICPQCHEIFTPKLKAAFVAYHTPSTRRLICPKCGHKGFCVEVYAGKRSEIYD